MKLFILRHTALDVRFKQLMILTDSEYIRDTFSKNVFTWEVNEWKRSKGRKIEHLPEIQTLHTTIKLLETTLDMAVRFWRVERADLDGADDLAKDAMNGGCLEDDLVGGVALIKL